MPQADLLSFQPTLLFLPAVFLVGYFFFVTQWVPRVLLTFKARAWLTRYDRAVLLGGLTSTDAWPELVLMALQFAALVWVVTRVALVTAPTEGLPPVGVSRPIEVTYAAVGSTRAENFLVVWRGRTALFFAPAAADLTARIGDLLGGFGFLAPAKQLPLLTVRLKKCLAVPLSGESAGTDLA